MDIYYEESAVRFSKIDQSDTLTIAATTDLFQEAAISHAEIPGVGRETFKKNGHVWIISRLSVFMANRPKFGETISIRTWPRGSNKLFAIRDYDIHFTGDISDHKDEPSQNNVLIRGRSAWLVVDIEKRRPLRPQIAVEKMPVNENINALPGENINSNDPPPSLTARDFSATNPVLRHSCYSDIDFNGHVNNSRYIQWIQDLLEPGILENAGQIRLDINYLAEVLYGETIELYIIPIDEKILPETDPLHWQRPKQCIAAYAIEGRRRTGTEAVPVFRAELITGLVSCPILLNRTGHQ